MSAEHDDGPRRRRSHRGARRLWIGAGVGVVLLLLVVNLAMSLPGLIRGETPDGFVADLVTTERLEHIGLWVALLPAAAAGVLGIRWAHEAFLRSERPTFLWLRRAFAVSLFTWAALIVAIMDANVFDRVALTIAVSALFSLNAIPFAMAARAAAGSRLGGRGSHGGSDKRRQRSRSSSDHLDEVDA